LGTLVLKPEMALISGKHFKRHNLKDRHGGGFAGFPDLLLSSH